MHPGGRGAPSTATTKASRPSNSVPTSLTLAAATARASSTHPTLLTLASKCDSSYIARLEANATDAASHASSSLSDVTRAVSQSVAVAASNARHHTRYADKRLGMKEEELTDTIKAYVSCLQQLCSAGLEDVDFLEDSWESINRLLSNTVDFPSVSFVVALAPCDARQRMLESTRIQSSIDPLRCSPAHDPWLARGASHTVSISMFYDSFGDCVQRLAVEDVECSVNEDAVGWSVVPVSLRANMLTLEVSLLQDCTSTAVLTVHAGGVSVPCPLKVRHVCIIVCVPLVTRVTSCVRAPQLAPLAWTR